MNSHSTIPSITNRIPIGMIVLLAAVILGFAVACLGFVSIKLRQHAVAEEIRKTERAIVRVRSANEVLLASATRLSSRKHLLDLVAKSQLAVTFITADRVARLTPPDLDSSDLSSRTALNAVSAPVTTR